MAGGGRASPGKREAGRWLASFPGGWAWPCLLTGTGRELAQAAAEHRQDRLILAFFILVFQFRESLRALSL